MPRLRARRPSKPWSGRSKYRNRPCRAHGRFWASQRELAVYRELLALQQAGQVSVITCQPRYELHPRPERIVYVPDFVVRYTDGQVEVIDVKGMETPVFKLKAKLFRTKYPTLPLRIVR